MRATVAAKGPVAGPAVRVRRNRGRADVSFSGLLGCRRCDQRGRLTMLTREGCARRQRRLQQQLEALGCDLFVTGDNRAAYYFTGSFSEDGSPTVFALWQDGSTVLATPSAGEALASEVRRVETYSIQRAITHPWQDAARLFADALPCGKPSRRAA